ncbi:CofH family radical SAM protein [Chlamydiifrater volucris]|uniref:CofH family radical SAM protein n=1 Tax=Chlamydiifrater volucris TaxID=2681470 RepID=UPI003CCE9DF0
MDLTPPGALCGRVLDKVVGGERLSEDDVVGLLALSTEKEISFIQKLADHVRSARVGDVVFFSSTYYLYPTNFCEFNCSFCAFYAKPGDAKGWWHTPEELLELISKVSQPISEVHIVSGCHPDCNLPYFEKLFSLLREYYPKLHRKGLTAVEYDYLAKLHGTDVKSILEALRDAGVQSLPGGGGEILVDSLRQTISPGRISSDRFLEIHRTAHELGLRTNATLLFDHIETPQNIAEHLKKLRDLQDETHGFKTLVPLKFANQNNALGKISRYKNRSPLRLALLFASIRLFLDNFDNIKSLWNYLGITNALEMLNCGANDFSSTHIGEQVFQMASSKDPVRMDIPGMQKLISGIGRKPCLVNSQTV